MKRFAMALILCLVSIAGFGQLNIQTVEESGGFKVVCETSSFGFNRGEIRYSENIGYFLVGETDNEFEKDMASFILGKTKESAVLTIKDLSEFRKNAEPNKIYITRGLKGETKIWCVKTFGCRGIKMESEFVAGSSTAIDCVAYYPDKFIQIINKFQE